VVSQEASYYDPETAYLMRNCMQWLLAFLLVSCVLGAGIWIIEALDSRRAQQAKDTGSRES
jgi:hypothetical protein